MKPHLVLLVVSAAFLRTSASPEQRLDGWFNNLANPTWGGIGDEILFDVPPAYADLTYQPSGPDRPNPRLVSQRVLAGPSGLPSYRNATALFAFFGQLVAYEVVHAADAACPIELLRVPVPPGDPDFATNTSSQQYLPFVRSGYNPRTGHSPNNPRRPVNKVSSWIDGNFIYGRGDVWCNCMRSFVGGQLLTGNESRALPALNKIRLPLENYPDPMSHSASNPEHQWMFGDPHAHQNPGLASLALTWFRYHNQVASRLQAAHPDWTDHRLFTAARRRVIAVQQNIVMYEWLPVLLNEETSPYEGYQSHTQPGVSALFEAAAFRLGHSLIPPGIYVRDRHCNFKVKDGTKAIRLCNSYFRSQSLLEKHGVEAFLLGLASQIAEREDHVIVDDLRGKTFGPLHYSRQDLAVLTLMRGRDHGLPDYNTARRGLGLPPVTDWADISPHLHRTDPGVLDRLRAVYNNSLSHLDVYTAGLLEATPAGPGPLFATVIRDQFARIRNADRYWFENIDNGLFTKEEIAEIRQLRLKDIIVATTDISENDIQDSVFTWTEGAPCPQPRQLHADDMEPCTPHQGFDYFRGSEVSYITAFTSFALIPFVCVAVACLVARCKRARLLRGRLPDMCRTSVMPTGQFQGFEWLGNSQVPREVIVVLQPDTCSLMVQCARAKCLRQIRFGKMAVTNIWVSSDQGRDLVMVHVPREYDLVLRFASETQRGDMVGALRDMLRAQDKVCHLYENTRLYVFQKAFTKRKREDLLTRFFRSVFTQARTMEEISSPDEIEITQCKEIVDCELSRDEFAEALALRPDSLFVNQMFSLIDRDKNGYISFRELLYAVLLFAKGSCEDKLHLLFIIYDRDKSGSLSRTEVFEMIRSMMEMANTSLCGEEVKRLVDQMFVSAGLERRNSLRFSDFQKVLSEQMHMFWDVCIDWKGTKICFPKKKSKSIGKGDKGRRVAQDAFEAATVRESMTRCSQLMKRVRHYTENNRHNIVYVFVFMAVCGLVFTERFYVFAVESEQQGLRQLAGYGVSLTRGAAAGMSFTFSLLLLTMCRNIITRLRETVLNLYIPFDSHVAFHKLVAWTALFFTLLHIVGYCFNFYHIATQPVAFLCVLDEIVFRSDDQPKFHFWLFENLTGLTGVLLVVIICIMYIFATQTARTHIFSAFWITHQLFYLLYVLTLLHGCSRLIQEPYFPYYFIGPAMLFLLDKTISLSRKRREIGVVRAELLPSDVTMLEFKRPSNFEYRSGQWVRLACDPLGKDEYHALTLTSAPHEEHLMVHIRAVGPWTKNTRQIFDPDQLRERPYPKLYIDGPFGAGQQDWFRYDVSVLVGGGIGVTPYASILKDFVFMTSVNNTFRLRCQKVYFVWVTASQKHFEWLIDILRHVEQVDQKSVVETHIFITQLFDNFDLRTTMLYICEEHFQRMSGRSMFTGLQAKTHFGRPNFDKVLTAVHNHHPRVRKVGVFSCGPPGLTKGVQQACYNNTRRDKKVRFEHHFENF